MIKNLKAKNIILLGAPGAGKGTQGEFVSEHLSIPIISTGNIIRSALKSGTDMGLKAKNYIESGKLVPDQLVIDIIKERLKREDCQEGFILDGFPRTIAQAEALEELGIKIDLVLDYELDDNIIIQRISGRRVCQDCGASYHTQNNPSSKGEQCQKCGGTLVQRKDDHPEIVKERLKVYHKQTKPLIEHYKKQDKLVEVKNDASVQEVKARTLAVLSK